jgi:hypothetical protein
MNVNAMQNPPSTSLAAPLAPLSSATILLALKAGAVAAVVAALLVGRVPEPVIIVGIVVVASLIGWSRTHLEPARVRSYHRFTVVSRCGDGFVTIDSSGARRVARRSVLGSSTS